MTMEPGKKESLNLIKSLDIFTIFYDIQTSKGTEERVKPH